MFDFPLIQIDLPENQYVPKDTKKNQIFLHHTAGSGDPYAVVDWWKSTPEAVSTSFIVARGNGKQSKGSWNDGDVFQCFSSAKWGWHLGLKAANLPRGSKSTLRLNADAVGIEICNWGFLTQKNGRLVTYAGRTLPDIDIIELDKPFKGYRFWQRYTDAQIENTRKLMIVLGNRWNIPLKYKGYDQLFQLSNRCFQGESGVWTHNSVRRDKFDVFPQPELLQMLQSF